MSTAVRQLVRGVLQHIPVLRRHLFASVDYAVLTAEEARRRQLAGWTSKRTADRQDKAYMHLLEDMHAGRPRVDLAVAAATINDTVLEKPSILEVGCGSGYYREVFSHTLRPGFTYTGVDSSAAMVNTARQRYPGARFEVADACRLPFTDGSFDIVFNGVCLMHILDFGAAIAEGRRVARYYCVYHSVPLVKSGPTTYLSKYAYGGPVVELIFNRGQLMELFERSGLELTRTWQSIDYDVHAITGEHSWCESFLLRVR